VQGLAGVVVEPGDELDVGAGGEAVVDEVGLPALVGLRLRRVCRAPSVISPSRGDESVTDQDPADGEAEQAELVVVEQVPADGALGSRPLVS
jgi:hypothetical protein